jgi:hypothetical protein
MPVPLELKVISSQCPVISGLKAARRYYDY